jgi:hypothetical protein
VYPSFDVVFAMQKLWDKKLTRMSIFYQITPKRGKFLALFPASAFA